MKIKLLILAFAFTGTLLFSQGQNVAFESFRTTDGSQNFVYKNVTKTDGLGNVYVAGATINGAGNTDILLAKYNSAGVQLWIQQYAGSGNGPDFAGGLAVTNTDVYVTGAVTTGTNLATDVITMHYSSAGVLQWTATYNGTGNYFDSGKFVAIDGSNNVYITGGSYNASGNIDFVTIKYSSTGTQQWVNLYDYSAGLDDAGINIATSGSNVVVTGAVTSTTNNYKVATLTYAQSTGSLTATNVGTLITTSSVTAVTDLGKDVSGNIYIVGSTYVSGQNQNYYVQKLSNTLATIWTYTYNGSSNLDDIAKGIQLDASSNVYVTGYSTSSTQGRDITTVKLNSSGTQQWVQTINGTSNGDDEGADMVIDASANIYITGYINSSTLNKADYYTVKYNSSGTKIWDIQTDGNHLNDNATNMALDSLNNVIITGQSETAPNVFQFLTMKYVQKNVITPTDFNLETPKPNHYYYENKGQITSTSITPVPDVRYYTDKTSPTYFIKDNSSSIVFSRIDTVVGSLDTLHRVDLTHDLASSSAKVYPADTQKDFYLNYFLAHTGTTGVAGVFGNKTLVTTDLYPNIDLMYSSNQNGIKYYYIIKAGGNPKDIGITFTGASSFSLNGTTNALSINSSIGSLTYDRPTAYQLSATNSTIAVTGWTPDWQTNGASNKYRFNSGAYTTSLTLVIEVDLGNAVATAPASTLDNVKWTTYYGGNSPDYFADGAYSADDNYYTTGVTYSGNYPLVAGQKVMNTYCDITVTKFNANGLKQWATVFGGVNNDFGTGIAIDNSNNPVIVGYSGSPNIPIFTPSGAYTHALNSGTSYDGVILKIKSTGLSIDWSTYMGSTYYDEFDKVAINSTNDIYVVGFTEYSDFPYYANASFNQSCASVTYPAGRNGVIVKFTNLFPVASTCIGGGTTGEKLTNIHINKTTDEVYVVGNGGFGVPITNPGNHALIQTTNAGNNDAFILKYNASNTRLWSTYFGGSGEDIVNTVGMNKLGQLYIGGKTNSADFKHKFYNSGVGFNDTISSSGSVVPFIASFDTKDSLIWSTYYKLNNQLYDVVDLAFDTTNTLFVTGTCIGNATGTISFPNPGTGVYYANTNQGGGDAFFASFTKSGINSWGTYFGGNNYDVLYAMNFGANNRLYFCGNTASSANFPLANNNGYGTLNPILNGTSDGNAGYFEVVSTMVGIKEFTQNTESQVLLFPNPAQSEINIFVKENLGVMNYEMYNTQGQIVKQGVLQNNKVDIATIADGMYIIKLSNSKTTITKKFIKQ